jgi:general L-amino acid transport system substrate-binding protein
MHEQACRNGAVESGFHATLTVDHSFRPDWRFKHMSKLRFLAAGTALALLAAGTTAQAGATLDSVKQKGHVQCGVSTGIPGFSSADDKGNWTGIDVDVCRAVAAAVLGDANAVKYTPLTAKERLTALQSGEIDMLSRNTTWTATRDTTLGINFTGVNYL